MNQNRYRNESKVFDGVKFQGTDRFRLIFLINIIERERYDQIHAQSRLPFVYKSTDQKKNNNRNMAFGGNKYC